MILPNIALTSFAESFSAFKVAYPDFSSTAILDELRTTDYARLDKTGQVYLDYTGGGLYSESQLNQHLQLLRENVFGNPHSQNPTSLAMTQLVEQARAYVLEFFNADPSEYLVIFTPNATGALKLVGEAYPFNANSHYLLTFDNHNSVNGIREFAHAHGAKVTYVPLIPPDLRIDLDFLRRALLETKPQSHNLFAFPAQSNFSGVQHPLELIAEAQAGGWDVLLDAAAFAPTNRLDLSVWKPDFVDLSFYKIFGYPTGLGCLIARQDKIQKLHRPWYAGGTISFATVQGESFYLTPGSAGFEDGTVNYLSIPAVEIGLRHIAKIGIDTIHNRVECLTAWLLEQLVKLQHSNGKPLVRVYGPITMDARGGTIEVNFYDPSEHLISCYKIEQLANAHQISLRAGCHCNPGAREISFGMHLEDLEMCFIDQERMTYQQFMQVVGEKMTGALRASLGLVTTFADVYRYVQFAESLLDKPAETL